MTKLFKVALLSVALTAPLSAKDFLSQATDGVLNDKEAGITQLSSAEMNKVVGGTYHYDPDLNNVTWGAFQTVRELDETYNGRHLLMVATKYSKDLSAGYSIDLVYDQPYATYKNTIHGQLYDLQEVPIDTKEALQILYGNVEAAKNNPNFVNGVPGYQQ